MEQVLIVVFHQEDLLLKGAAIVDVVVLAKGKGFPAIRHSISSPFRAALSPPSNMPRGRLVQQASEMETRVRSLDTTSRGVGERKEVMRLKPAGRVASIQQLARQRMLLLAGLTGVEGFNVPERVGAGVEVKAADIGADGSDLEPEIQRDGRHVGRKDSLHLLVEGLVCRLAGEGKLRGMAGRVVRLAVIAGDIG